MARKKNPSDKQSAQQPVMPKLEVRRWLGNSQSMTRMASLLVLIAILVIITFLFYRVMAGFILPLFLAVLLAVIFRPIHRWMLSRFRGRDTLCAGLTTGAILCIVLLPLAGILGLAAREGYKAYKTFDRKTLRDKLGDLGSKFGFERPYAPTITSLDSLILDLPESLPVADGAVGARTCDTLQEILTKVDKLRQELAAEFRKIQASGNLAIRAENDANTRAVKRMIRMKWLALVSSAEDEPFTDGDGQQAGQAVAVYTPLDRITEILQPVSDLPEGAQLTGPPVAEISDDFPKLKAYYLDAREKLHGGFTRMIASDIFFPTDRQFADAESYVAGLAQEWLPSLTGQVTAVAARVVIGIAIMLLGMFYFLKDGPGMIRAVMKLSPLDDKYEQELLGKFDSVSRAVVLATLLSALVQGMLAGIGYYVAGLQSVFLLTMLTMLMAMIPVVGSGSIWIPTCLWLAIVDNRIMAAVLLAAYGAGVVSMIDNVIKPMVLHGQSNLHPLLGLLSVLGGVKALGPIGIIVGPMSVSFLQALLNMLQMELQEIDRRVVVEQPGLDPAHREAVQPQQPSETEVTA
jgi:predicted PurR-regulated permease PerM